MTYSKNAPFRADVVGSYLRPDELKQARADYAAGIIDAAGLKAVEDRLITDLVAKQKAAGLHVITDGEFRRGWWHFDFMWGFNGVGHSATENGLPFHDEAAKIDGANGWKTFWKITVPLLKPTIIMTFIMSINGTLQLFDESMNLTKGGPANSTITMSHYVYNTCFVNVPNFGYAAAMSFIIFIMVAILAFINLKVGDTRD